MNKANKKSKREYIHFQVDSSLKESIKKIASDNGLKVGPYIKMILTQIIKNKKSAED